MDIGTEKLKHNIDIRLLKDISNLLEKKFFYNKDAYGKQQYNDDGNVIYKTIYNRIDANVIRYMLNNKYAIMSYQQKFDKLKWLCLDFDVKSSVIKEDYDFFSDNHFKPMLVSEVTAALITLDSYNIKYILEFSGNRGFHIWILLNREVTKQMGSAILNSILNLINFEYVNKDNSPITIDKYPKNNKSRDNKIGLGVKIPLSFHLKSNSYSYLINKLNDIEKITEMSEGFIVEQRELIDGIGENSIDYLIDVLNINSIEVINEYDKVVGTFKEKVELDNVISMLSKCKVYEYIFSKEISELTELDRSVITGTFIRLQSKNNNELGKQLLIQYFSSDANVYNEEITNEKLLLMQNFFPPSLLYLQEKYNIHCPYCEANSIKNVLELLDDIVIKESSNSHNYINWMIRSEQKYLTQNDEVPLNFIYDDLDGLNEQEIVFNIEDIKNGEFPNVSFHKFERHEEDKLRILYGLSAKDRVLTTYFMYEINKILYGEYASSNSYSYRLNYDYKENDIFVNWNNLWLNYVKNIEDKILNDAYDDYYVLKLDIKSFYGQINQIYLREILYSKPTSMIELVLKNLDQHDKKKYINMCEYLIHVSEKISEKGVPQGPAFARYLAEIYLSSLDQLIMSNIIEGFEHYYRYVDDLVIILETKEKAEELLNLIKAQLGKRDLILNEKVMKGYVSDLKHEIISQDLEKYFIDGIDEGTAPKLVIEKAISILNAMFRNQDESINIKQMPFYLTHLINKDYIEAQLDDLILEITNSAIGRGSLFKHFYKNIIFKHLDKIDLNFYKQIKGLSRANFINELTRNLEKIPKEKMSEIINFYLEQELEPYEKKEIFRIILKYGYEINRTFNTEELDAFVSLLQNTKEIKWSSKLINQVLKYLQSIEDKNIVLNYMNNILSNTYRLEDNTILVETIYIGISEHINTVSKEEMKQTIFNLIAYVSLYIEEVKIIDIWTKFYTNFSELNVEISSKDWYKFERIINKQQIKDSSVILILTKIFKQEGIVQELGTNKLEEDFALYLFLYLFENKSFSAREEMKQKVREITKHKNIQFIDWCLSENTQYFPKDETAIKNIQYNNRIVMMKDNVLLVRGEPEIFSDYTVDPIHKENWYDDNEYQFVKINVHERLMSLEEKIKDLHIFKALDFIVRIKKESEFNGKFVNVFEKGAFVESNDNLNLTFSKHDNYLVLEDNEPIINERRKFTETLIQTFLKAGVSSIQYPLNYCIDIKDFSDDFIPKNIKNPEDIMVYLELLNNNIKKYLHSEGDTIYTIELSKIISIKEFITKMETRKKVEQQDIVKRVHTNKLSSNIRLLTLYNSLYSNQYEKHLLYSAGEVDTNSLGSTIHNIIKSIKANMEYDSITFMSEFFSKELKNINEIAGNNSEFKLVKVERHVIDNSKVKINGVEYLIDNLRIYEFGTTEPLRDLSSKEVFNLIDTNYVYFNEGLLVSLSNSISKIIEIIQNKDGKYDKKYTVKDATIRNTDYYTKALDTIKLQSDVSEVEAERRIHEFLANVESKYYLPIFKILSSYRCFTEDDMCSFVDTIIGKIDKDNENDCFFPLKNKNDDNGLHQILYVKNKDIFERKSNYENRLSHDFEKLNKENNFNEVNIISDLGVSGKQLKNAINHYIALTKGRNPKEGFHKISNGEIFKQNLLKSNTISIVNCIYTDIFKKTVTDYFVSNLGYSGNLNFEGIEIPYKEYLFSSKITKRHKELFIEFVKTYFRNENLKLQGKNYFEYLAQLESENTKNMLIARYKSMPKYHNIVFTKNTALLKYRED
ncbi:reverse transcriptase domain-containing protein [Metabacillus fastidiosus]|uniref:reverse transcriptase domain-containing protein n=1 Tax=Metabacillus fastidiosus TaxID=1458 RepID=UPI002E1B0522|nr:reverse transcriptase domain-containing protein [Metabacillus fastidiosus]